VVEKNSKLFSYLFQSTFFRGTETQQASQQGRRHKRKTNRKKKKKEMAAWRGARPNVTASSPLQKLGNVRLCDLRHRIRGERHLKHNTSLQK
jgi:hypothetical protein